MRTFVLPYSRLALGTNTYALLAKCFTALFTVRSPSPRWSLWQALSHTLCLESTSTPMHHPPPLPSSSVLAVRDTVDRLTHLDLFGANQLRTARLPTTALLSTHSNVCILKPLFALKTLALRAIATLSALRSPLATLLLELTLANKRPRSSLAYLPSKLPVPSHLLAALRPPRARYLRRIR